MPERFKQKRGKAVLTLDGVKVTVEQALLLLTLDDFRRRHVDLGFCAAMWRRWLAANLTFKEWVRRGFRRAAAEDRCRKRLRELAHTEFELLLFDGDYPELLSRGVKLAAEARTRFVEPMGVTEFTEYCSRTYDQLKPIA